MTVHYDAHGVTLHHGDCLDILATLPDASVDAVVTDPPYGLEFMGKEWDSFRPDVLVNRGGAAPGRREWDDTKLAPVEYGRAQQRTTLVCDGCGKSDKFKNAHDCPAGTGWTRTYLDTSAAQTAYSRTFQSWCTQWATECLRVLKPGGHLLAFGGTRTWHRLACAIEDAGFEIRDSIAWMYGSGFPKSHNLVSDWAGWGTALKPAHEPIVVARKPLAGTVAANVLAHGTGALNVDGCRIGMSDADAASINAKHAGMDAATYDRPVGVSLNLSTNPMPLKPAEAHTAGRWPANVVLDESQAAALDAQSGTIVDRNGGMGGWREDYVGGSKNADTDTATYRGEGGASRFYYTAKADATERPNVNGTRHPTVKPLDLMRWLVRLVTPPGGVVLEPFAGSGTTAEACLLEGFRCIAVEREADYLPLVVARITRQRDPVAHVQLVGDDHPTLFDEELA